MRKCLLLSLLLFINFQTKAQLSPFGLYFDGTGDRVSIPAIAAYDFGSGPFTLEAWFRNDDTTVGWSEFPIISNFSPGGSGGFKLTITGGFLIFWNGGSGQGMSSIDFRDGICHHVAITGPINGAFLCYVDGVFSNLTGAAAIPGADDLIIGASADAPLTNGFHGLIKEVRLWNTTRTQSQIQTNMNTALSVPANPNLVGYWPCNSNNWTTQFVDDWSINNNYGTLGLTDFIESSDPIITTGCPSCPLPSQSITAGGSLTICPGGSVTLTVTAVTGQTYQWYRNGVTISGATQSTYNATIAGSYGSAVTNSCGYIYTNSLNVTVQPAPSITISSSSNVTAVCTGGYAHLLSNASTGSTFQWKSNGTVIPGATASSYQAYVAGNYTCTATNACGSSTLSNTINITADTPPPATITAGGPTTFCNGKSVVLSANTGTNYTYNWLKDGNIISGVTSSSYAATQTGNYQVRVIRGLISGCITTSSGIQVTVTPSTTPATVTPPGPVTNCGGSVILNVNTGTGFTYKWKNLGIIITGATSSTYAATLNGNYVAEITNSSGCISTSSDVLVSVTTPVSVIGVVGGATICAGGMAQIFVTNNPTYTYQWKLNGAPIAGATSAGYLAAIGGSYTAVVTNVCGSTTTSPPLVVTVLPPHSATITPAGPILICSGGPVTLTANTGPGLTYKWRNNGDLISGATSSSYTATLNGNYSVEVRNSSGCSVSSLPTLVTFSPPTLSTITSNGATTFCTGGSVTLNTNAGPGVTYQWKKNGVSVSGATSSSYVATTTGSYTCYLSNSCGSVTSNSIQVTASGAVPATPGSITTTGGVVKVCPGESRTYSVVAIAGVTYTWTPCAGSTITSGQNTNSVTVQYNAGFPASDTLRVIATNSCGSSAQRKLKISRNTPGTPGSIIGDGYGVCNLSGKPYSITSVTGMTYTWSFNTGAATIASGQGTSNITANYAAGFVSGVLSVTAGNGCGTSAARVKTIYAKPATPVSITGATSVCLNQQDVPYSIAPLANVTNYTWTGPTGSHISDGVTTSAGTTLITTHTSVTVDYSTTAGSVKVRGNNACASGSYKSLTVAIVCREGEFSNAISETRIYPNPAATDFTLETDDTSNPFDVEVYDAYGRLVFSEINLNSGYQVNTNGWEDGLYSVIIHRKNDMLTLKLVILK